MSRAIVPQTAAARGVAGDMLSRAVANLPHVKPRQIRVESASWPDSVTLPRKIDGITGKAELTTV